MELHRIPSRRAGPPDWPWFLATAGLAGLATPPVHLLVPSFIFLAPAVVLIERSRHDARPLGRHFGQGFRFGVGTNLAALSWLPVALWRLQPALVGLALAILLFLAACTGVLFAVTGALGRKLGLSLLWIFPPLWIAFEWLQAHLGPFSFPRLGPAASLASFPVFLQLADIVGSRGIDYLLTVVNTALGLAWLHRRTLAGRQLGLVAAAITGVLGGYGVVRMRTLQQRLVATVAILQPNIGFRAKWDRMSQDSAVRSMVVASRKLLGQPGPDLMLWPEVAVPDLFEHHPQWRDWIIDLAVGARTPVVVGGLDRDHPGGADRHFNAAFVFGRSPPPDPAPVYHKRHLVPWVEWLPRGASRSLPFDTYSPGDSGIVFRAGRIKASVIICFEAAFAQTVREDRLRGAEVVLNPSNDAWVSGTVGPWQGPAHLVLRAIENRVGVVRAANTGPSQSIRPDGVLAATTPYGVATGLIAPVWTSSVRTLFTQTGDWVGPLTAAWSALLIMMAFRRVDPPRNLIRPRRRAPPPQQPRPLLYRSSSSFNPNPACRCASVGVDESGWPGPA